jgi:hypothetical protein
MSNEQDQQVTVRLLPDGDAHPAHIGGLNGHLLQIDLSPIPAERSLKTGDLVEVTCPKTLYLGEVHSRQGETMIVGIEHSLDRETLALIQQVWHGPPGR